MSDQATFRQDRIGGADWGFLPGEGKCALVRFHSTGNVYLTLDYGRPGANFIRVDHPDYEWAGNLKQFKELVSGFVAEGKEDESTRPTN